MTDRPITAAENERLRAYFDRLRGLTQLQQADRDAALVEQAARWEATERECERLRDRAAELEARCQVLAGALSASERDAALWHSVCDLARTSPALTVAFAVGAPRRDGAADDEARRLLRATDEMIEGARWLMEGGAGDAGARVDGGEAGGVSGGLETKGGCS